MTEKKKKENLLLSLLINIAIPSVLMMKGDEWFGLPGTPLLCLALAFPLVYGVWDFVKRRKFNFIAMIGFVSVLMTGGIGLLELPKEWIAIKDALVPLAIGIAVIITNKTKKPLIKMLLINEEIIDVDRLQKALNERDGQQSFDALLHRCTYWVAFSFLLSSILNFVLAKWIVVSESGTAAFTQEIGKMTALSYPVIAVPCMAIMLITLMKLFKGIKVITGLGIEELVRN